MSYLKQEAIVIERWRIVELAREESVTEGVAVRPAATALGRVWEQGTAPPPSGAGKSSSL